jgi:general secretion pathway protein D
VLGAIPLIGQLFKTRNSNKKKTELMVFIHPTVIYDGLTTAIETNAKYNAMREAQMGYMKGKVTLMSGEKQPALPPLEDVTKFVDPTTAPKPKASVGESIIDGRNQKTPPPTDGAMAGPPKDPAPTAPPQVQAPAQPPAQPPTQP